MVFHLRCECGEYVPVSEGAAGAQVPCPCGRTIAVPSLADLRKQAGLPTPRASAALVIDNMLARGQLPTVTLCAHCNSPTDETAEVTAECEKVWTNEPSTIGWMVSYLFLGIWALLLQPAAREYGNNLIVHLPVRVCRGCQRRFVGNPAARGLGLLAVLLAAAGILVMILWTAWGAVLLAATVF